MCKLLIFRAKKLPLVLDRIAERPVMLAGGLLLGLGMVLGVIQPGFLALLPIWFVLGIGGSLIQTPSGRLLKKPCQKADRSAFFSAQFALSHLCWLISYPLAGWLGRLAGLPTTFGVLAVITFAATLAAVRVWRPETAEELEHVHEPMEHTHRHVHDAHHRHPHQGWEGTEPHRHRHHHERLRHRHRFFIDLHHPRWPIE